MFIMRVSTLKGDSLFNFVRWEFRTNHEEWLTNVKPDLGAPIAARAKAALETSSHLVSLVQKIRDEARFAINELLKVTEADCTAD